MWVPEAAAAARASWLSAERGVLVTQTVVGSKKGRSAFEDITNKKEDAKVFPTAQKVCELGVPPFTCLPHSFCNWPDGDAKHLQVFLCINVL